MTHPNLTVKINFFKENFLFFKYDKLALPYSLVFDAATSPPLKCARYCAP
jgi:hypothetical protein